MLDIAAIAFIVLVLAQVVVHRRLVAALWFRREDPRPMALLRLGTGLLLLAWIIDVVPLVDYLFTADGLVDGARAHRWWGRNGPWSPLFEHDDPGFVHAYLLVFGLATAAFTLGLATAVTKWLTWAMFLGLVVRNGVFVGGEQVFGCVLFYLCLCRCGEAYSVDAWHRRKRGEPPRLIPAWPRNLLLLQMIAVFTANGFAKYGEVWRRGDIVHWTFNHPHFRPADMLGVSELFATNLFRVMTWVTHGFELLFFLLVVGMVVRFAAANPTLMPRGRARLVGWLINAALALCVVAMAGERLHGPDRDSMPYVVAQLVALALVSGPLLVRLGRRLPPVVLRWVLGRRVWVTLWLLFTAQLAFVLKIGWFTNLVLWTAVITFEGHEIGHAFAWVRRRLRMRPGAPYEPIESPAAGRLRRSVIGLVSVIHVVAVLEVVLPVGDPQAEWRKTIDRTLRLWVRQATFTQFWRMFAPGGKRMDAAYDLEVLLVDGEGQAHPLGDGVVPPEHQGDRWGEDKRQKIRRRLSSPKAGKLYWPYHARYVCRQLGHTVPGPARVEIVGIRVTVPPPRAVVELGADEARARAESMTRRAPLFEEACDP